MSIPKVDFALLNWDNTSHRVQRCEGFESQCILADDIMFSDEAFPLKGIRKPTQHRVLGTGESSCRS